MKKIVINGGRPLKGEVTISGVGDQPGQQGETPSLLKIQISVPYDSFLIFLTHYLFLAVLILYATDKTVAPNKPDIIEPIKIPILDIS